jgi:hypothetical protein
MKIPKSAIAMDNFGVLSMHRCAVEFKEFLEIGVDYGVCKEWYYFLAFAWCRAIK